MIKTILLLFLNPKVLLAAGSILLSIWTYGMMYGWAFAAGFVGLIFCHEMGHYIAAKQRKLNVGLPIFIPFVGAFVTMKDQPHNAETEAYVAYAGPFVGTLASFAVYYWGRAYDSGLASVVAQSGFVMNLFNLIPLSPLDGGRITAVLSPRIWLLGLPMLIGLWFYQHSPILILVAVTSLPQVMKAWHFNPKAPEHAEYYNVSYATRFEYGALYLILIAVLATIIESMSGKL